MAPTPDSASAQLTLEQFTDIVLAQVSYLLKWFCGIYSLLMCFKSNRGIFFLLICFKSNRGICSLLICFKFNRGFSSLLICSLQV